jgi:hypothetical protein
MQDSGSVGRVGTVDCGDRTVEQGIRDGGERDTAFLRLDHPEVQHPAIGGLGNSPRTQAGIHFSPVIVPVRSSGTSPVGSLCCDMLHRLPSIFAKGEAAPTRDRNAIGMHTMPDPLRGAPRHRPKSL